jgi:hypothetical protein
MSLRSHYYSELAAGRDVSGHDGRPRPTEYCGEPAIGPPDEVETYQVCGRVATDVVQDTDGRTYAMCPEHGTMFRTRLQGYRQAYPVDGRD